MTSFMFIISFLLHIVLLIAIYHLFQQIQLIKKENTREITDLFDSYLQEIKAENRRLQEEMVTTTLQGKEESFIESTPPSEKQQKQVLDQTERNEKEHSPNVDHVEDRSEASLQAKILQLHNQGMSEENIAKKLNCGKTEVALIIKLYA